LFLAAKVEEQPRKLEHVIKIAHTCINQQEPALDTKSNVSKPRAEEPALGFVEFTLACKGFGEKRHMFTELF